MSNNFRLTPAGVAAAVSGDFENFLAASTPGGIERQEAKGHADLCREASRLPLDLGMSDVKWEDIEREWGIKRGAVAADIFYSVNLPEGWKLEPTDHSMWSALVDETGAVRASIFYKAAFYDRNAHMSIEPRYHFEYKSQPGTDGDIDGATKGYDVRDRKTGKIVFVGPWAPYRIASEAGKAYLAANYPDHENPFAYWKDTPHEPETSQ